MFLKQQWWYHGLILMILLSFTLGSCGEPVETTCEEDGECESEREGGIGPGGAAGLIGGVIVLTALALGITEEDPANTTSEEDVVDSPSEEVAAPATPSSNENVTFSELTPAERLQVRETLQGSWVTPCYQKIATALGERDLVGIMVFQGEEMSMEIHYFQANSNCEIELFFQNLVGFLECPLAFQLQVG